MSEENKATVRCLFEEIMTGNELAKVDEVFAADYHEQDPGNVVQTEGREGVKAEIAGYRSAFSDLSATVEDQLAEGDQVATRFTIRGTHDGELDGVPPSGNRVTITGIAIHRVEDGQIQEAYFNWDTLGLAQQTGALPAPQPA